MLNKFEITIEHANKLFDNLESLSDHLSVFVNNGAESKRLEVLSMNDGEYYLVRVDAIESTEGGIEETENDMIDIRQSEEAEQPELAYYKFDRQADLMSWLNSVMVQGIQEQTEEEAA